MAETKEKEETSKAKKPPKRTSIIGVAHKKWHDSKGIPQPRWAAYDPEHPGETVGAVADRFADEQGIPGTYTFSLGGKPLDRDDHMSKVKWPSPWPKAASYQMDAEKAQDPKLIKHEIVAELVAVDDEE